MNRTKFIAHEDVEVDPAYPTFLPADDARRNAGVDIYTYFIEVVNARIAEMGDSGCRCLTIDGPFLPENLRKKAHKDLTKQGYVAELEHISYGDYDKGSTRVTLRF